MLRLSNVNGFMTGRLRLPVVEGVLLRRRGQLKGMKGSNKTSKLERSFHIRKPGAWDNFPRI